MLQINRNMFRNANDYHNYSIWNVMAHAQKPDFVFRWHGQVHLNRGRGGLQFGRLLAAEVCASAVVMLDTPCSEVVWRVLATHSICLFPLPCITTCHHISIGLYHTTQGQITALCHAVWWTGTKLHRKIQQVGGPCHLKFMLSGNELENCCLRSSSGERSQHCWGLSTFS